MVGDIVSILYNGVMTRSIRRRFLPFAFGAFFHAAIVDKQKAFLLCCYDKVKVITTAEINSVRTKFAFGRFPSADTLSAIEHNY